MNKYLPAIIILIAGICRPVLYPNLRDTLLVLFQLASVGLLSVMIWKHASRCVAVFFIMAAVSHFTILASGLESGSLVQSRYSFSTFYYILCGMIIYLSMAQHEDATWVYNALCVVALVNVFYIICQKYGHSYDPFFTGLSGKMTPTGLMSNPNETSALLGFCGFAFLRKWWWVGLFPVCVGVYHNISSGGAEAFAFGLAVYLWVQRGEFCEKLCYRLLSCMILAVCVWFLFLDGVPYGRLGIWGFVGSLLSTKWMFGYGIGQLEFMSKIMGGVTEVSYAHNEYIQLLFYFGLSIVPVFFLYVAGFLKKIKRLDPKLVCGFVTLAANSFVNFGFHIGTTAMIGLVILGLIDRKECVA